jgi:hypothetical protein
LQKQIPSQSALVVTSNIMIQRINRETIFKNNSSIASELYEFQKAFFNLEKVDYREAIDETCVEYLEHLDLKNYQTQLLKKYYKIISFEHSDLKTFTKVLGEKLALLLYSHEINNIFVYAHLKMNFFGNLKNDYKPLKEAYKALNDITGNLDYNEGFETNLDDLPSLIDIAFWIERCDPSGPEYIFFNDIENRLSFFLCKDGNVHIIEYGKEIFNSETLAEQNWFNITGRCNDKFTEDGAIEGRKLKL